MPRKNIQTAIDVATRREFTIEKKPARYFKIKKHDYERLLTLCKKNNLPKPEKNSFRWIESGGKVYAAYTGDTDDVYYALHVQNEREETHRLHLYLASSRLNYVKQTGLNQETVQETIYRIIDEHKQMKQVISSVSMYRENK
ncbi:MAG: hypothetical protein ACFB0B_20730 [Thermonemataceae bacterium]